MAVRRNIRTIRWVCMLAGLPSVASTGRAELRFANIFNHNMVLQQQKLRVWE